MLGAQQEEHHSTLLNENGALRVGDQIRRGFLQKFERTFHINDEDNDGLDRNNENTLETYITNNRNIITLGQRTDLNCNFNRGVDMKIHTHDIMNEISTLKNKAPGTSGINKIILQHCPKKIIYSLKTYLMQPSQ